MIEFRQTKAGDITIRIPRASLRYYTEMHDDMPVGTRVTNTKVFSDAVLSELQAETDDGSTLVDLMVDEAIIKAIEEGAEGVKLGDEE